MVLSCELFSAAPRFSADAEAGVFLIVVCLTPRWSQRRLPLEFMDGLSYTTIIEPAEPLAGRRGSALDR